MDGTAHDDSPGLELRPVRLSDPDPLRLVAEVQAEYVVRYGGPDETPMDAAMFDPPGGAFFVGYLHGLPAAMGGWRMRPELTALGASPAAEIKRMFVVAPQRRRGLARLVLGHLEDTARAAGAGVMVLETGVRQPEALSLYQASGYVPVEGFGHYRHSPLVRYLGRRL